jgi:hypothetical protein
VCAEAVQSDKSRCEIVKSSAGTVRNSLPFGLSAPQGWRHSVRPRSIGCTFYIPAKEGGGHLVSRPAGRFLVSVVFLQPPSGEDHPQALFWLIG